MPKQAQKPGFTLNKELQFLFIHGLLHIFGYDHKKPADEKKMKRLEEEIFHGRVLGLEPRLPAPKAGALANCATPEMSPKIQRDKYMVKFDYAKALFRINRNVCFDGIFRHARSFN